jgi:CheY-like chemotaxis protein
VRRLPGYENVPVLMLTGLDDDASITRAYQAGATDFFVKATQWSLLAGRLHYLLRASRTRIELERSKSKLARAQDLARMGSFDWWRSGGGLLMSAEALRVLGYGPQEVATLRNAAAHGAARRAPRLHAPDARRAAPRQAAGHRRDDPVAGRPPCASFTSKPSPNSTTTATARATPASCRT